MPEPLDPLSNERLFDELAADINKEAQEVIEDEVNENVIWENSALIVDLLIIKGVEIPSLRILDGDKSKVLTPYEMMDLLYDSDSSDQLSPGESTDEKISVLNYVASVAACLESFEGLGEAAASEDKRELQVALLDDQTILDKNKLVLLEVLDELVPIEGLDLTDQNTITSIREQRERRDNFYKAVSETRLELMTPVWQEIKKLRDRYGDHDSYESLASKLLLYLSQRKVIGSMSEEDEFRRDREKFLGIYFNDIFEVTDTMNIPGDHMRRIISGLETST